MAHRPAWTPAVALAIAALSAAAPLRATDEHRVPLDRLAGGLWTLRAHVSPRRPPLTLLVDTGAERTVLSRAAAARAGLVVRDGAHLATPTGIVTAGEARVPGLAIGGRTLADVEVLVADLRTLGRGATVDGILGMDLLGAREMVFDFDRGLLTLSNGVAQARPAGVALSTRILRGRLVVEARIDGRARHLVLDTGAETLVLFEPLRRGRRRRLARRVRPGLAGWRDPKWRWARRSSGRCRCCT